MPCSAAGKRPTALITEVRPPIQSNIGKRASQPLTLCILIQLAIRACDCDRVSAKIQSGPVKARFRFEHSVARFLGPAGFRNHDNERVIESRPDLPQDAVETIRIGVIEKEDVHLIARRSECVRDELRPERRTSDSDEQEVLEGPAAWGRDPANVDIGGKFLNARVSLL